MRQILSGRADELLARRGAFYRLCKAVVQIQNPPVHGHPVVELLAGQFGKAVILAEVEHLHHGFLVDEAGDVVEGAALVGLKIAGFRILTITFDILFLLHFTYFIHSFLMPSTFKIRI